MSYSVKILADSINPVEDRLTTFELSYPRFIHAEFMTHRLFSRNAASSRAIPISKMIERVLDDPALPLHWGKNQKGMQAAQELSLPDIDRAREIWLDARNRAVEQASMLNGLDVHKQIVNRLLEPFMFITVICTATEWTNFFYLRDSEFAMPEIAWLAREMKMQYAASEPVYSGVGDPHLPLVAWDEENKASPLFVSRADAAACGVSSIAGYWPFLAKISVARCARVSYLTHDGKRDLADDLRLYDQLKTNGHWSPFEHVARACHDHRRSGNFIGWEQHRKQFENEHHGRKLA